MKQKYIVINLILFAFLYFSVSFNKEYIRPIISENNLFRILFGCFPNFLSAYIISLFPIAAILGKKITIKKSKIIIYSFAIIVFLILTIEEFHSFFGASSVFDIYDIIANGVGMLLAVITFEILLRITKLFEANNPKKI